MLPRSLPYGFVLACVVAALVGASTTSAATTPRVTVIGDSILTAVQWNTTPMAILGQGFDLQMEIGVCRRIEGQSCPFEGGEVPTLIDLVPQLGSSIAPTVIVEVGSNDPQDVFAQEVEDAMHVLLHYGVTRVLWVNFHEVQGQYPAMNQALVAAAQRYPELSVVDWNGAAANHPEWFQTDGIHLVESGAEAMATLLHNALLGVGGEPPPPPDPPLVLPATPLPAARAGRAYAAQLVAKGGAAPYRWQVTSGPL
ncbi:MAG: hypothetical protein QOG69_1349, partial [Actinomycetota bacterium]|nr:hypothetical protein [Actinomycetota bacterium]